MKKVSKIKQKNKTKAKPAVKKVKKSVKSVKSVKKSGGVSPLRILSDAKMEQLKKLHKSGQHTAKQLAKKFDVSISTLYNYLNR